MKQMLKNAQRILDECSEDHLHPANNRRHPFHQQALKAIAELEEKIMELTEKNRPLQKGSKMKLKKDKLIFREDDQKFL
jgi:Mg2+ and Co2+ transporter CorA